MNADHTRFELSKKIGLALYACSAAQVEAERNKAHPAEAALLRTATVLIAIASDHQEAQDYDARTAARLALEEVSK